MIGYYSEELTKNGKRGIVFSPTASHSGLPLKLPCGQCVGCRLEKSRQWAVRCVHESKMHDENVFVTLTYDDDNLPAGRSLVKRDLQLFMKRLRKSRPEKVRFYACGEYGDVTERPHYHILLFGTDFPDKKKYKENPSGGYLYDSSELRELWPFGSNLLGDVTFDSAAYVARYCMKKITGDHAEWHYAGREPEFSLMSRRPGIGATWLEKYGSECYRRDSVVMNGVECKPPRFYDVKYKVVDSDAMSRVEKSRRRIRSDENSLDRRRVREKVCYAKLNLKRKTL